MELKDLFIQLHYKMEVHHLIKPYIVAYENGWLIKSELTTEDKMKACQSVENEQRPKNCFPSSWGQRCVILTFAKYQFTLTSLTNNFSTS